MRASKFMLLWVLFTVTYLLFFSIIGNLIDYYFPHRFGIDIQMILMGMLSALVINLLFIYLSFAITKWLKNISLPRR